MRDIARYCFLQWDAFQKSPVLGLLRENVGKVSDVSQFHVTHL